MINYNSLKIRINIIAKKVVHCVNVVIRGKNYLSKTNLIIILFIKIIKKKKVYLNHKKI